MGRWAAAGAGVAAVALGAGVGELVAGFAAPGASPVATISDALIDVAPAWAKETAIAWFGTGDKIALVVGVVIVLIGVAAGAGLLEARRPPVGRLLAVAVGIVGIVVALTRPGAGWLDAVPSAVAGIASAVALGALVQRMPWAAPRSRPESRVEEAGTRTSGRPLASLTPDRRRFLAWTGGAVAVGAAGAVGGQLLRARASVEQAARDAVPIPAPAVAAPGVPRSAELHIDGLARVVTPTAEFYRIDTAIFPPSLSLADWRLRIHGLVEEEVEIGWDELVALPLEESYTTLMCVSNEVGGTLIGTAKWLGYPIRELLARARPTAEADMVLSRSVDGFTASSPLEALTDDRDAILAVAMNDGPLPQEHGFPVRIVVPGLYGYVSATKWVSELEVTRFDRATAYWTDRGWSERGPIKLESRIDVSRRGRSLPAGEQMIAGVAWQQHTGVSRVEVQIDDGDWQEATLASAINVDTWVQWMLPWTATAGSHTIRCRATNALGETQTDREAPPIPDGASGWHTISVSVS